jgi:hypothetical protein
VTLGGLEFYINGIFFLVCQITLRKYRDYYEKFTKSRWLRFFLKKLTASEENLYHTGYAVKLCHFVKEEEQ